MVMSLEYVKTVVKNLDGYKEAQMIDTRKEFKKLGVKIPYTAFMRNKVNALGITNYEIKHKPKRGTPGRRTILYMMDPKDWDKIKESVNQ